MHFRKALWGIVLILIGGLFIMDNLNILDFHWASLLSLWPVIFILWGISILPVKNVWKTIFTVIILIGALGYAFQDNPENRGWWFHRDNGIEWHHHNRDMDDMQSSDMELQQERIPYDSSIAKAKLELEGAAGTFHIKDTSVNYLLDFRKKGNTGKYKIEPENEDGVYVINIERDGKVYHNRNSINKASIKLNSKPVWDIELDLGAADARMDLSPFKVNYVDVEGGASNIRLKLGSKVSQTKVNVDAGVSNFDLLVPESSGCRVQFESVLSGKNMDGFKKESSGLYLTPGYEDAKNKIDIVVEAAISNFEIKRY
ncbi:MAG: DUF5668 domain-containing protein [Bacteroidales bacterium]|nr:DUF5668 domain-containing protein [Bacteroidales bacterium]MCF8327662.1 DUF5668 domain-containing protein [Bacteroidales bacterium]